MGSRRYTPGGLDCLDLEEEKMSDYTTYDLNECLDRVSLPAKIAKVVKAWGIQGREYADWTGGFVVKFVNGQYGYISGWSDSSGWG